MQTIKRPESLEVILTVLNRNFTRSLAATTSTSSLNDNSEATPKLKSWRKIPGPSSLPIIGPFLNFLPGGALSGYRGFQLFERVHKLYGPIARIDGILGNHDMVWLFDADAVAYILRSENTMPVRPGFPSLEYYRKKHNKAYDPNQVTGLVTE